ncbi:hypothetical protein CMO92_00435 [Candidatus Woesearchaeota archaeon]|nr:hypothetical protein [Candidatus Woesearchaeota archaeon]
MKELFKQLPQTQTAEILLDTCAFYYIFQHHHEKQLLELQTKKIVALTSFNIEEILHTLHHIDSHTRNRINHHLKKNPLPILEIPIHPGNRKAEQTYVNTIDSHLLNHIPDPSDAVLIAAALTLSANVITKDKHHLFTAELKNYLSNKKVHIYKTLHDLQT